MAALRIAIEGGTGPQSSAVFGVKGGTLGRADHNTLVLSDAERSVSRLHARVDWHETGFKLVNMGLNTVIHNGALLGPADEAPLAAGDVLRIGRFSLLVDSADPEEQPLDDADALFDDMTGAPLPRRAKGWSDSALFDDSGAGGMPAAGTSGELLRGMGCAVPIGARGLGAEQTGQLVRRAIEDTLRVWIPHCSPAVQQAWFTNFEEALARISSAESQARKH